LKQEPTSAAPSSERDSHHCLLDDLEFKKWVDLRWQTLHPKQLEGSFQDRDWLDLHQSQA